MQNFRVFNLLICLLLAACSTAPVHAPRLNPDVEPATCLGHFEFQSDDTAQSQQLHIDEKCELSEKGKSFKVWLRLSESPNQPWADDFSDFVLLSVEEVVPDAYMIALEIGKYQWRNETLVWLGTGHDVGGPMNDHANDDQAINRTVHAVRLHVTDLEVDGDPAGPQLDHVSLVVNRHRRSPVGLWKMSGSPADWWLLLRPDGEAFACRIKSSNRVFRLKGTFDQDVIHWTWSNFSIDKLEPEIFRIHSAYSTRLVTTGEWGDYVYVPSTSYFAEECQAPYAQESIWTESD